MAIDKWSDDGFLDQLRQQGDPAADGTVRDLIACDGIQTVSRCFQVLSSDAQPLPPDAPPAFREFIESTADLPAGIDLVKIRRGQDFFTEHAFNACVVMLAASLPAGYSAPCLSQILTISGDLERHPYKRLMGVVQLLVDTSGSGAFEADGRAMMTAQKLRLLHAGVRSLVPRYRPDYEARYGVPVNHEDMLATLMGFSYLVVEGLRRLELAVSDTEADDFYYLWSTFARLMGIHPPGRSESVELVPQSFAEATVFYEAFSRRHYTGAADNPDGVKLAQVNLEMMESLIPKPLRRLGLGWAPMEAMLDTLGAEGMRRVGIEPPAGKGKGMLSRLLSFEQRLVDLLPHHFTDWLARELFQDMIDHSRDGQVKFIIPTDLEDLHRLA